MPRTIRWTPSFQAVAVSALILAGGLAPRARATEPDAAPKPPAKLTLGLLSVTAGEGFDDKQINTIEEVLLTSFEATGRFKIIGRSDITALMGLESQKQALGCAEDSCVAEIAGALGVDLIATADVGRLGSTTIITLKVILVRTATALERLRRTVTSNDDLVGAMDSMAAEVSANLGGAQPVGHPAPAPPERSAQQSTDQPPPPRPAADGVPAYLLTPDGAPRGLHLQLGAKFGAAYTIAVTTQSRSMKCPVPLSPTQGCDLRPIDSGDAHYSILEGTSVVKLGVLNIPVDGAQFKVVKVRPGWASGLGITACVLAGLSAAVAAISYGIATVPEFHSGGDAVGLGSAVVAGGLLIIGIPVLVAVHSPALAPLDPNDAVTPGS